MLRLGDLHITESAKDVVGADYAGSHWLASFLTHALLTREKLLIKKLRTVDPAGTIYIQDSNTYTTTIFLFSFSAVLKVLKALKVWTVKGPSKGGVGS